MPKKNWRIDEIDDDTVYDKTTASQITGVTRQGLELWIRGGVLPTLHYGKGSKRNNKFFTGEELRNTIMSRKFFQEEERRSWVRSRNALHKRMHRERHPLRQRARQYVTQALKNGSMRRRRCEVCGSPTTEAHHDDYSRPADVRWFCREHHIAHHGGGFRSENKVNKYESTVQTH